MARRIDWESQIGRRLKLRDLHVFCTVAQCGSMAKAAQQLGVSQPAISEIIADLEHALRVRLLDRQPQGVEPTMYGNAVLKRSIAVFDELKQSIRDVEFMADPATGELRIGCVESLSATLVPQVLLRFSQQYPRVVVHVDGLTAPAIDLVGLRNRKYDCTLVRWMTSLCEESIPDDINAELLFDDQLVIAAGINSPWARRRKIDLAELIDEQWILPPSDTWHHARIAEAFQARGLGMPNASFNSLSMTLRMQLMAAAPFISVFAKSVMQLNAHRYGIAMLPIDLSVQPWPVAIVTLKNRTLSPVVERFIASARDVAKSFASYLQNRKR
jgi:DNA-binding transcriptional LysR family regulator